MREFVDRPTARISCKSEAGIRFSMNQLVDGLSPCEIQFTVEKSPLSKFTWESVSASMFSQQGVQFCCDERVAMAREFKRFLSRVAHRRREVSDEAVVDDLIVVVYNKGISSLTM